MDNEEIKYVHLVKDHNLNAPGEIVPHLINIFHPDSVADVGCGLGTFLNIFLQNGVTDVSGIDGMWVDKSKLVIPEKYFTEKDLEQRLHFERKFDLVLCLEVAEHLSEQSADVMIENLVSLGDIILFSAAIKNQGGQNHINEQPANYWMEKFKQHDFVFYDVFRNVFWNNPSIDWWYKQNMFLVANRSKDITAYISGAVAITDVKEYVHPELLSMYTEQIKGYKQSLKTIKGAEASPYLYYKLLKKALYKKFFSNG
ncbi:MAG TPA: class I SAM-dependent methyltransferase [Panacibacter sp.]|nr:class I SAM-dependent methyltransferase [Panacibacter sp.]